AAGVFLADALEHAFGAAALDTHGDAGEGGLERFRNLLCQRQVDRGVVKEPPFFCGRLDEGRRNRRRFGRCRPRRRREKTTNDGSRRLEHVAPGEPTLAHSLLPVRVALITHRTACYNAP